MLTFVAWIQEVARAAYRALAHRCAGTSASLRDADILFPDQAAPLVHVAGEHRAQIRAGAAPDLNAERLEFGLDVGRGERLLAGGLDLVDDRLRRAAGANAPIQVATS